MISKNKFIELDEDIDNTKTEDIDNTKTEDVDNTKTEDIDNSKPYIDKDIKPYIDKDTKPDIKKDTKPDIKKDSNPNIKIDKKTSSQVFKVVKFKFKNKSNWEKKVITWVFWKSPVSELCEKWIYYNNNYAYTRYEEFRTCSGEVLFTNEHKAVFSKNKAKTYIDINDLEIFKDFSKENKTKFKRKPRTEIETITTETIKIITAKKDNKY